MYKLQNIIADIFHADPALPHCSRELNRQTSEESELLAKILRLNKIKDPDFSFGRVFLLKISHPSVWNGDSFVFLQLQMWKWTDLLILSTFAS